jgi:hypothetical protein
VHAYYYPAAIAIGLFLLTLSFLLPETTPATLTARILAVVAFALAVIFAIIQG